MSEGDETERTLLDSTTDCDSKVMMPRSSRPPVSCALHWTRSRSFLVRFHAFLLYPLFALNRPTNLFGSHRASQFRILFPNGKLINQPALRCVQAPSMYSCPST